MLALSERTIERLRVSGLGPKFVRCGRSIRYRLADVEEWIASRVFGSTSETQALDVDAADAAAEETSKKLKSTVATMRAGAKKKAA